MDGGREISRVAIWAVRITALAVVGLLLRWNTQMDFLAHGDLRYFPFDWSRFWRLQAVNVLVGIAFTVAVRFPFPRSRFAWGRLSIAGIALLPVVHVWFALSATSAPLVLRYVYWIDNVDARVWSILAGVAIGAGFGARRAAGACETRQASASTT